ncbi:putative S-layer protein [Pleurocapsa sp. PCC 7327]|uniref:iron uptake porin n=1 Tax=Pleurocapsa sp. PCC 7327 TaxID=118163 RepID=UPI00029F8817|nr:iron uptake porin [Pleurocapsa sp. PCC 7327]AFY79349.1 putative S-layer protein [Pleurocapsa sp. PCC 7327]
MSKIVWKSSFLILAAFGTSALVPSLANAGEVPISVLTANQLASYSNEDREKLLAQVTSIAQFSDVAPGEWAFEALQNLVEEYGCVVGYPDRTYRGNRPLTRYEFAAGMNACLQAVERRMLESAMTTREETSATAASTEALSETFNRAFSHNSGDFFEGTDPLGQLNNELGIIPFQVPASFPENQITRDAELLEALYKDTLQQQSSLPRIRTRDLPNPFNTSLRENPNYIRPAASDGGREVIIERSP